MKSKLITLTTDFGYRDPYVGIMKGVILGINPEACIVDLTHGLPPQNVLAASLSLRASVPYFPEGSIHVAVVDPGVGSERLPILIVSEGSYFVGPDNGIFTMAVKDRSISQIVRLSADRFHLHPSSNTFHGRDIFAPVAAHLSLGIPPEDLGTKLEDLMRLPWRRPKVTSGTLEGEIIYIDRFGNLITNVAERELHRGRAEGVRVVLGSIEIQGIELSYAGGKDRAYVALINSWGLLEIAVFQDSAADRSGAKVGDKVIVRQEQKG